MTVWEACKPLLVLLVGAVLAAGVIVSRRRKDSQNPEKELPNDVLADLFLDEEQS